MKPRISVATLILLFALQLLTAHAQTQPSGSAQGTQTAKQQQQQKCSDNGTYVNSKGQTVKRPENCSAVPEGATAQCRDGTYSFSRSRRGTCSHHGGVAKWLVNFSVVTSCAATGALRDG